MKSSTVLKIASPLHEALFLQEKPINSKGISTPTYGYLFKPGKRRDLISAPIQALRLLEFSEMPYFRRGFLIATTVIEKVRRILGPEFVGDPEAQIDHDVLADTRDIEDPDLVIRQIARVHFQITRVAQKDFEQMLDHARRFA